MRITSKGQVTIPAEMREQAGLLPHTEVNFELDGKAYGLCTPPAETRMGAVPGSSRTCEGAEMLP